MTKNNFLKIYIFIKIANYNKDNSINLLLIKFENKTIKNLIWKIIH